MGSALTPRRHKHSATKGTDASKRFSNARNPKEKFTFRLRGNSSQSPESQRSWWHRSYLSTESLPEGHLLGRAPSANPQHHCSAALSLCLVCLRLWSLGMSVKTDLLLVCKCREELTLFCEVGWLLSGLPGTQLPAYQEATTCKPFYSRAH